MKKAKISATLSWLRRPSSKHSGLFRQQMDIHPPIFITELFSLCSTRETLSSLPIYQSYLLLGHVTIKYVVAMDVTMGNQHLDVSKEYFRCYLLGAKKMNYFCNLYGPCFERGHHSWISSYMLMCKLFNWNHFSFLFFAKLTFLPVWFVIGVPIQSLVNHHEDIMKKEERREKQNTISRL